MSDVITLAHGSGGHKTGELISEVDRDFCTGIVPEEVGDSYIEGVRTTLDTRLVDALSAGARPMTHESRSPI